jgi:hypothetical protein
MHARHGTCVVCKHTFRVPASASVSQLECPKCGGAVEIGATRPAKPGTMKESAPASPSGGRPGEGRPKGAERGRGRATSAPGRAERSVAPRSPKPLVIGGAGLVAVALLAWLFVARDTTEPATSAAASPAGIDLVQLADLPAIEGTSDEDWAAMNELVTRYRTPPFGPASVQSGDRLMNKGKAAVPAILNGFKRLDLTVRDQVEIGLKMQMLLLQGLCNDTNFGWRRETRPEDVLFNQKVVQRWFEAWRVAGEDDEIWAEIARIKDIPSSLPKRDAREAPAEQD